MKTKTGKLYKAISIFVLAAVLIGAAAFIPSQSVAAAAPPQQGNPPAPDPQKQAARLENLYQREKAALDRLTNRLDRADTVISKVESWIGKAQAKGLDVSRLEEALKAFKNAIDQARPFLETARGILGSHAGFDSQGKVTDPVLARQTVRDTGAALQGARHVLNGSLRALIEALRDLRQQIRNQQNQ